MNQSFTPLRILLCSNPAFFQHVAVVMASVIDTHRRAPIEFHLIGSSRDDAALAKLEIGLRKYPNVSLVFYEQSIDRFQKFFVDRHLTRDCYLRPFAAELLPADLDRILYLDADVVIVDNLYPLYEIDLEGHALAAAPDLYGQMRRQQLGISPDRLYVNSGVLLMNLAFWREHRLSAKLQDFIEQNPSLLELHDQDAINAVLREHIKVVDQRWNVQTAMFRAVRRCFPERYDEIRQACRHPAIIHYAGPDKPWLFRASTAAKRHYYRYLDRTEWRDTSPDVTHSGQVLEYWVGRLLATIGIDYMRLLDKMSRAPSKLKRLLEART